MKRFLRIFLSFLVWLIPLSGIYFSTQMLYPEHHVWGFVVGFISSVVLLPMSGILFDAITNDRVLWLNIDKPWKSHLGKRCE